MPINPRKDISKVVAVLKAYFEIEGRRYFYSVYLWPDPSTMVIENKMGNDLGTRGLHLPMATIIRWDDSGVEYKLDPPKLGEIHFVQDEWDMEVVAHEVEHASLSILMRFPKRLGKIIGTLPDKGKQSAEEEHCYLVGELVRDVYNFLWENNPNKKWVREKDNQ